jgi:hypothetical protein
VNQGRILSLSTSMVTGQPDGSSQSMNVKNKSGGDSLKPSLYSLFSATIFFSASF